MFKTRESEPGARRYFKAKDINAHNLMLIAVLLVIDSSWSQSGTEKSLSNHIAVIFFYGWHKKEGNNRIGTRHKSRAKSYLYCL